MIGPMSYRRYTQDEREQWLAKFEESSSSAAAFCREHGLSYASFLRWRRQAGAGVEPPTEFIELEVGRPGSCPNPEAVEVTFPSGIILRIFAQPAGRP